MAETIKSRFVLRRGKLEEWESVNPISYNGEPCFAYDENILKIGDGVHTWKELPIINESQIDFDVIDGNTPLE